MSESKLQQEVVKYCKERLKKTGDERYDYLVAIVTGKHFVTGKHRDWETVSRLR